MRFSLTIRDEDYQHLRQLLFPEDGHEVVAFALCGVARGENSTRLLVHEVIEFPDSAYLDRSPHQVCWNTRPLIPLLYRLEQESYCILKCHSHPDGLALFSELDDTSDRLFLMACYQWNTIGPHASLVLSESEATARIVTVDGEFQYMEAIKIIGEKIVQLDTGITFDLKPEQRRLVQAFGEGTYKSLSQLRVAVIGASGTGSLVIEALARTGVGQLVLVDYDEVEKINLNRILHSTQDDVINNNKKTSVAGRSVESMGLGTEVTELVGQIQDPDIARAIASCDLIMGCVDNREARHILCRISAYYLLPYIDAGVAIRASDKGEIENIVAGIHYIQPGQSFIARGVFDQEALRAEAMQRTDLAHYNEQRKNKYVSGVKVERPAVMPLNMIAAGFAVMELLNRIHGFRLEETSTAETLILLDIGMLQQRPDPGLCAGLARYLGRGDTTPLLGMPAFSELECVA